MELLSHLTKLMIELIRLPLHSFELLVIFQVSEAYRQNMRSNCWPNLTRTYVCVFIAFMIISLINHSFDLLLSL